MEKKYDAIIVGAGQAGPSLAGKFHEKGKKIALVEREHFGGTCVNTGCTPTKTLVANAKAVQTCRQAEEFGISMPSFSLDMKKVKERKDRIVHKSSSGLKEWLEGMEKCDLYEGHAVFEDSHTLRVGEDLLVGEQIFLDVGGRALIPEIPGLSSIPYLTNSSILDVDFLPEHLVIVGGGYIALEFSQIFRRFGSRVTVLQRRPFLMPKEDEDVSVAIREILEGEGIEVCTDVRSLEVLPSSKPEKIFLRGEQNGQSIEISGSHLLLAAGRIPNTGDLQLEKAGVEVDKRGFIQVNDSLQTSTPHIFALGDCNGKGAFTHTSYNDFEIVADHLFGKKERHVSDRIPIYALFTDPPLGRVGMTEKEIVEKKIPALTAKMPMTSVARAREKGETAGFMKIFVEEQSGKILGAALLGTGCDEVVHLIADVMYAQKPYTVIQNAVHIHPTVSELIPTLLSSLEPLAPTEKGVKSLLSSRY